MPTPQLRTREATLDRASADEARRTVSASLSSEAPVRRGGEIEVLRHDDDAVDLTRAADGLPLLFSHDRTAPIGIVENVRLEQRRLVGQLRFGQSARAAEIWRDVVDGVLKHISISYAVDGSEPIEGGYAITRWSVYEASVVSVPADPTVGIGRSASTHTQGEPPMSEVQTREPEFAEIRAVCTRHGLEATFADGLIQRQLSRPDANAAILEELARRDLASGGHRNTIPVDVLLRRGTGAAEIGTQRDLMVDALAARMGAQVQQRDNPYRHARIVDMARDCLEYRGVRTTSLAPSDIVERALHTTGDFPELLAGAGQRTLRQSYTGYAGGVKRAFRQSAASDFRAKQRLMLGEAPDLLKVNEHGEFTRGTMAETKSSYALSTFGRIFGITRQALVNDDLDAFGEMTVKLGRAAAEFEAKFLVALLLSNPAMSDGAALFHATHGNLGTGGGSSLSFDALKAARTAMRLQKGLDGTTPIDATPRFLIVPATLETTAEQILATISATKIADSNPFSGKLELIVDPRLDATSTVAWYLAADPGLVDTIEYSYLESAGGPEVIAREGFEIDGMEMKVRLDFGAGALDWRGLYKGNGA